jgi:hypothetical protein
MRKHIPEVLLNFAETAVELLYSQMFLENFQKIHFKSVEISFQLLACRSCTGPFMFPDIAQHVEDFDFPYIYIYIKDILSYFFLQLLARQDSS